MKSNTTTMAIKARVFNKWRAKLYKRFSILNKPFEITDAEIAELFVDMKHAHQELNEYKRKRKDKAIIHNKRVARGYKAKKKTSLAEYEDKMRDALLSKVS